MNNRRENAKVPWSSNNVYTFAFGEVAVEIGEDE